MHAGDRGRAIKDGHRLKGSIEVTSLVEASKAGAARASARARAKTVRGKENWRRRMMYACTHAYLPSYRRYCEFIRSMTRG